MNELRFLFIYILEVHQKASAYQINGPEVAMGSSPHLLIVLYTRKRKSSTC